MTVSTFSSRVPPPPHLVKPCDTLDRASQIQTPRISQVCLYPLILYYNYTLKTMYSLQLGWGLTTIEGFSYHVSFSIGCVILVESIYLGCVYVIICVILCLCLVGGK